MGKKIVLIGAGSVMFMQGLVIDMMKQYNGGGWKLALVDIDPKALDIAAKLCRKMLTAKNSDIELSYSTDRCDVLPGADYVVTTIGVGGRRAWEQDVYIPRKYGVYQPVGDSVMAGGISRAMRMIPAMLDITEDVQRLCPDACLFNYANPMTMICRAVRKKTGFPIVGLCHGVFGKEAHMALLMGLEPEKVSSLAVGLNHLTFIYDYRYEGKDIWPLFRQKVEEMKKEIGSTLVIGKEYMELDSRIVLNEPLCFELFDAYNAFPVPGDRHITEYYAERYPEGKGYYGKQLGVDAFSFEGTIESGDREFERMERIANSCDELPDGFFEHIHGEHEQLMEIIYSIEHDQRKIFYMNVSNNNAVYNLPDYTVLEMPVAASARGMMPLQINNFPDVLAGIVAKHAAIAETAVEAALNGDRRLFAEAVLMGGYITDRDAVVKMVDELIEAQKGYLPQFK